MPDPLAVGEAVLKRFMLHNDELKAQGVELRQEIRQIIDAEPDLSTKEIHARFTGHRPCLRTVQRHLRIIRDTRRHVAPS